MPLPRCHRLDDDVCDRHRLLRESLDELERLGLRGFEFEVVGRTVRLADPVAVVEKGDTPDAYHSRLRTDRFDDGVNRRPVVVLVPSYWDPTTLAPRTSTGRSIWSPDGSFPFGSLPSTSPLSTPLAAQSPPFRPLTAHLPAPYRCQPASTSTLPFTRTAE